MNRDTKHVATTLSILIGVLAVVAVTGGMDYQSAIEYHDKKCGMLAANIADQHLPPEERRGWPEEYPGQYAAECDEEQTNG